MTDPTSPTAIRVFDGSSRPPEPARGVRRAYPGAARRLFRSHGRAVQLLVENDEEASVALAFTPARGGIHVWRSLAPNRERLEHLRTLPGPFTPLAIARHLASGAIDPVVDRALADNVLVEGVDDLDASLIRLAWVRTAGVLDPRVPALLRLSSDDLAGVQERTGLGGDDDLLELADYLVKNEAAWLAKWKEEIDAEVERRAGEGADDGRRGELRAFVEECLLLLGRMPRPAEEPGSWDGLDLRDAPPSKATRRRLRLDQSARVRRFSIGVHFWSAAETYGYSDFGPGPGWYFVVRNPDPEWRFNDPEGPYRCPADAYGEAEMIGGE